MSRRNRSLGVVPLAVIPNRPVIGIPRLARFFIGCASLLALAISSPAAIWSWSGGGGVNAYWDNSANWGFAGIPASGDTVIFSASQPNLLNTNNIAGLSLAQVRFVGAGGGYDIRGNAFTLAGNLEATNSTGANTIENAITFAGPNQIIEVTNSLTLSGVLSGSSAMMKTGSGTLVLNGPHSNAYGGLTTVAGGLVKMSKIGSPPAQAVPHDLLISNATVEDVYGAELTVGANLTIVSGGVFQLDAFNSETLGTSLVMTNGSITQPGSGLLSLSPNATITAAGYDYIYANLATGSGTLNLQGPGTLYFYGTVFGSADIVQNDPVNTIWFGANTYSGNFVDNSSGYVELLSSQALGNTNNQFTLNGPGFIALSQNINITNQSLTFSNGTFGLSYGSIFSWGDSTNTWRANFVLATNCWVSAQAGSGLAFNIVSSISGAGGLTLFGGGEFTLNGPNNTSSYAGDTVVNAGTLYLNGYNMIRYGNLMIGDGVGGPQADVVRYLSDYCIYGGESGSTVVITNSGWLDLNGHVDDVGPITMSGGTIDTEGGSLQLFPPLEVIGISGSTINGNFELISDSTIGTTNSLTMNANVSSGGNYTLTEAGGANLYLYGTNTYTGTNNVLQGWLWAENSTSLGSANNTTIVGSGATLALNGNFAITNASLVLNGPGEPLWGALDSETLNGTNIWVGPITLNADSPIAPYHNGTAIRIQGTISGPGGLNEYSLAGNGTNAILYLEGTSPNSYSGTTTVSNGTLVLDKPFATTALPGNLVIESNAAVRLANSALTAIADTLVNTGALFDFGTYFARINTLQGAGTVNFGLNGYITLGQNNGSSEFDGSFTGQGFGSGYTVGKYGSGTFTIGGNSSYLSGITHVYAGTVIINGSQPTIPVTVDNGATLGGSGTVGVLRANGTVAPGNGGPGILTCSNVIFTASGRLAIQLDGPAAGSGYGQLVTLPTASPPSLANATLQFLQLISTPVAIGQQFDLLQNGSGSALSGIFNSLPEGSPITLGNYSYTISYVGGSGHDVVLTLTSIPGSAVSSAVTSGDGAHGIDPNGCNGFYLVISNQTSSAMNGVGATLSSLSENAIATQPFAAYPNIPPHGTATNLTPFQVSILPSLVCGSPLTFQLGVNSSIGAFAPTYVQPTGEPVAPVEYDNTGNVSIPDVGTVDSPITVSGFTMTPLTKVTVSLFITHPYDSDLTNISLISPDGTTVLLSSANGGSGQNYGSALTPQSSRTTFDDAAATSITAGTAPFVGTFQPQSPLSALAGNLTANGTWHLHIADGFGGSLGTLRGWSLFLSGTGCGAGGGSCALCPDGTTLTNTLTTASSSMNPRIARNLLPSACGTAKAYPGVVAGTFYYDAYPFYNSSSNACITISLASATADLQPIAYLGSFDPSNIANNYLGDSGNSTGAGTQTFSVNVPANTNFVVVVNNAGGVGTYTLNVSGGDCQPILNITEMGNQKVDVSWPTVAGGFNLQATPALGNPAWAGVTNEPFATANHFNITNSSVNPSNQFYRLSTPAP